MISILNTIGLMDGFKVCVCPVDPTNQTELDALQPTIGNDKVWEDGKNPTWAQVLAKQEELNKTVTSA